MYYTSNFVTYSTGVQLGMAKTAILVSIIGVLMMQSVSGAPNINYNQDHVESAATKPLISTKLYIKGQGTHLPDLDGWTAGNSDPYMEVIATDVNGYTETKTTPVIGGTNNAYWDDYLEFSQRTWEELKVNIMDYDGSNRKPDRLCPMERIPVNVLTRAVNGRTFHCYSGKGHVEIRYSLPQ